MSELGPVAIVFLPELMDPFFVEMDRPLEEQVPEVYVEKVREAMKAPLVEVKT